MITLLRNRRWFYIASFAVVLLALVSIITPPAFRVGIDFAGGTAITVEFEQDVTAEQVRGAVRAAGQLDFVVQRIDAREYFIRTAELRPPTLNPDGTVANPGDRQQLEEAFDAIAPSTITGFDSVSGIIGGENVRNAIIAVIVAAFAILFYVAWAFRGMPKPFRWGATAIVALLHDVIIVLGVFSLGGKVWNLEVNAMFISGVLTVVGYSVNDTIVVFDRLRENVAKFPNATMAEAVATSIRETLGRSLITGMTTLIVVVALLLFGGESIRPLIIALAAGITVGTYSSIFIASSLLVSWEEGEVGRLFRFGRKQPAGVQQAAR
ncbi:MAG: protein translocase subunit SecF [SAR202 cluster bacterium]|nr:protein translocase subunit SecF [SAR202 cluster bacterium]